MPAARDAAPIGGAADRDDALARTAATGWDGGAGWGGGADFTGAGLAAAGLASAGVAGLAHFRSGTARRAAAALGTVMIAWHFGHLPRLPASSSFTLSEC